MNRVYSWMQEYPDDYSRFSVEMMKVGRNDFSCLERIFKMAAGFVPTSVLAEKRNGIEQGQPGCQTNLLRT